MKNRKADALPPKKGTDSDAPKTFNLRLTPAEYDRSLNDFPFLKQKVRQLYGWTTEGFEPACQIKVLACGRESYSMKYLDIELKISRAIAARNTYAYEIVFSERHLFIACTEWNQWLLWNAIKEKYGQVDTTKRVGLFYPGEDLRVIPVGSIELVATLELERLEKNFLLI